MPSDITAFTAPAAADAAFLLARAIEAGALPIAAPAASHATGLRVPPPEAFERAETPWDIGRVDLEAASGGFDAAVQVSAAECLRRFNRWSPLALRRGLSSSELESVLAVGRPFANPHLNDPGWSLDEAVVEVRLEADQVRLSADGTLSLRLRGRAMLGRILNVVRIEGEGVPVPGPPVFFASATLGDYEAMVDARWVARIEPGNVRVAIVMETASLVLRSSWATGDFLPFHRSVVAAEEHALLVSNFAGRRVVPLTPALSIAGRAPAHESAHSLVSAVEVGVVGRRGREAFAVGWNFSATRPAAMSRMQHFVGPHAFAVLHSTPSVQAVVRNLWSRPEFGRSFEVDVVEERPDPSGTPTRYSTAVRVALDAPDVAACTVDSVTRGGCLRFRGRGTLAGVSVRGIDGSLPPPGLELPTRAFHYDLSGQPSVAAPWSPAAAIAGLQRLLHRALESLMRPLEHWTAATAPNIEAIRIDGVRGRALFAGRFAD
ncbi:hypothetical protein [Methylibium rhizosphaerae]|uniref:hypothetical protein n=1 Tax=Methylibium rhizosphaerae TaxID=2570323 RepID=UPI00112A878D|nr:hypothetical protein [Methylibium rhizosphaerae]